MAPGNIMISVLGKGHRRMKERKKLQRKLQEKGSQKTELISNTPG
jgi:hypothetical protein